MDEQQKHHTGLGRDFLTWLCYKSDSLAGRIEVEGQLFQLWVDRKIVLEDDSLEPASSISFSGDTFTSDDLKAAIRSGKKVREARLRLEQAENTWTFTLRADRFEIAGLKIDMPSADDIDERFHGRVISIGALNAFFDACYGTFLDDVLSKKWKSGGYQEFQAWLQTGAA